MKTLSNILLITIVAGAATVGWTNASAWWNNDYDDYYYDRPWRGGPWYGRYPGYYGWGGYPGYGWGGYPGYGWGGYPGYGWGGYPGYGWGGYPGYGWGGYPGYGYGVAPVEPAAPSTTTKAK
jgi:hypothetical protein